MRAQRKREREKARHASMTQEERDEKIKKLRKKYHQIKENTDATELKREKEKARLAAMTQEERNEKNRKRRERYH